ncbi:MAG: DUF4198 domain-containing protein [Candidatus Marinarcus sp.]|uniref:DUF4198 domain-containing protein n=1 Tax=Candidatus Marinarcus sp. TaxID=3100987 RepID=UPI003B00B418
MKKLLTALILATVANAHFLTFISNHDVIENQKDSTLTFDISFIHPFEQSGMTMEKPIGVYLDSTKTPIPVTQTSKLDHKSWKGEYKVKRPGIYQFFVQPTPYFEPSEEKFISHVPKLIVSGYGLEEGWDKPLGLKYEIVPLVKPFGLYAGNIFSGVVLHNGKPAADTEVEVELYNEFGLKAPSDAHVTQVVKTNANGEFSFVMNHKGWWGFAALIEEGELKYKDGKSYPIENGALIWVKAY